MQRSFTENFNNWVHITEREQWTIIIRRKNPYKERGSLLSKYNYSLFSSKGLSSSQIISLIFNVTLLYVLSKILLSEKIFYLIFY